MKTFTNTHTLLYHINDSISIPLRYSIIEGTSWFVGKDVAAICGYKDTWKAIKYHVSHQEDIIRNLTSDIPLADKRQILNRIVRFGGNPHTRWPFLYREFDNKFHMNTKVQLEHYNETHKPKLQNRLDYIEHIGMFNDLAEIACVIFGPDIEKLSAQYYEICK